MGGGKGKQWRPDTWPVWRKEAGKILHAEGPQSLYALTARLAHLVPPDLATRLVQQDRARARVRKGTERASNEASTWSAQRRIVSSTLSSGEQTGFFHKWINQDDVTMIDLGPSGRKYYEERDAQGDQSATVQRAGETADGTD